MIVPLFVPLVLAAGPAGIAVSEAPDPPVQVWFDQDGNYDQGDRVRVFARALRDGYMVILHADLDGRVRVLFPLDPVQDDFVRGGQTLEILGRGEDGAFAIVQPEGYGTVLAAWSPDPFYRESLVRGDHWDYRVIAPDGTGDDPEAGLLDIVHVMAGDQPFEYHTAQYLVGYATHTTRSPSYSIGLRSNVCIGCSSDRWYDRSGFSFSFSIGNPSWSVWYGSDPWYRPRYRPVYHYYDPWRYVYVVPVYRPVYWYDPWYDPWWSWRPVRHRSGVSVGIRYAGCWSDCGPRWGKPYRPGRATGVTFGDAYWRSGGSAGGATGVAWGGTRNAQGQGIARGTAPTRYAVPKDSDAGRGTGTAQPSRIGETRNVVTSTPPSRTRSVTDDPVRSSARDDQRIRQQAQPSRAPVVTSSPQNTGVQRPDRSAVVRSGTQATPSRSESGAVRRGIGQSNPDTRIVPEARTSNGVSTRSPERSTAIRREALPGGSTTATPPATSRSGATTRSGIATRSSNPNTRAVPSRGSSDAARAVPRSSTPPRVSPPARSSGGAAARAGSAAGSGSSSRAAPTRSSGASRSGGVAARAGSSRGSASGAGGVARSRSGGSGG